MPDGAACFAITVKFDFFLFGSMGQYQAEKVN
jgi:hypothetical protein